MATVHEAVKRQFDNMGPQTVDDRLRALSDRLIRHRLRQQLAPSATVAPIDVDAQFEQRDLQ